LLVGLAGCPADLALVDFVARASEF
jgi:hypothetical protein